MTFSRRRALAAGLGLLTASGLIRTSAAAPAKAATNPDFYFGADLSYVNEMEDCGAVFRQGGKRVDPYHLFADTGHNLVRLRLWNNPDWTTYSHFDDVRRSMRRAKASGQKVLLDFHYSDDWADGDKQWIPKAWENIPTTEGLAAAVYQFTFDTLTKLAGEGLMPHMVQVGNETNKEMMGRKDWKWETRTTDWVRNAALFNAGIRAVREAGKATSTAPKIMLHIAQPENAEPWFAKATEAGVTDFDYIGLSYYRKWSSQGLDGLNATIARLTATYQAKVIVVETSYPWTTDGADEAANLLGPDTLIQEYPATPEGQLRYLVDLTQGVISHGGVGVVYWEPAWVSTSCKTRWGKGSHWENATFFDFKRGNEALPAFGYVRHPYVWPN
ncbi:glycoside hydrolase family 53 protein [Aquidulcibacter paucihalophilus]|uniref:glycoside hydrolase family 53 protein n=1 Tax=Aquidulcibacter paucihalophilus TaxID=1978549 RepID=UPI000A195B0F|nr:glycosyl hydrolase 53 family protein [Aquidulcibacter paucihalophilus]